MWKTMRSLRQALGSSKGRCDCWSPAFVFKKLCNWEAFSLPPRASATSSEWNIPYPFSSPDHHRGLQPSNVRFLTYNDTGSQHPKLGLLHGQAIPLLLYSQTHCVDLRKVGPPVAVNGLSIYPHLHQNLGRSQDSSPHPPHETSSTTSGLNLVHSLFSYVSLPRRIATVP